MSKNNSKNGNADEPELRLADEEDLEVIPLKVENRRNPVDKDSGEEEFGLEIVSLISETNSVVDQKKKPVLFQNNVFVDEVDQDQIGILGKSFRSKDLSEDDISEVEPLPELEDKWIQDEERQPNQRLLKRAILVVILLLMTAGTWALLNLGKTEIAGDSQDEKLRSEESERNYYQNRLSIKECVQRYVEANSMEERAQFCRDSKSTLVKMKSYYRSQRPFVTYQFKEIAESFEVKFLEKEVTLVAAKVSKLEQETEDDLTKNLLIEKQEDGSHLIDWETAVSYQPNDWAKFRESRSTEPQVFRVEVEERLDHGPYLYEYSDDRKYHAYKVKIRGDDENFLLAYAKLDSEVNEKINRIVLKGGEESIKPKFIAPMMLKLVYPKDAQTDQCVEIIEVISDTWFLP